MNKSTIAGILAAATVIIGTAGAALAPAASAATPTASGVRTAIQSAEVSTSVQILTTKPNSITVIGHGGQPVTVWTKGTQPITKKPASASPVTFTGLKAGQSYAVYVGATQASVVRTLTAAGVASAVTVQAGPIESSIDVSWSIALPAGTKASSVSYVIEATSPTASPVTMKVIGTDHALITGLSPDAKYSFTVTPMLGAVKGTPASATMIVTVAEAFALAKDEAGGNADQVAKPATPVAPVAPVAPAAPSAPAAPAAPAGPAAPSTRTIYVCATGFTEAAGLCQKTAAHGMRAFLTGRDGAISTVFRLASKSPTPDTIAATAHFRRRKLMRCATWSKTFWHAICSMLTLSSGIRISRRAAKLTQANYSRGNTWQALAWAAGLS